MSTLIIDARRIAALMQPDLCTDCKRSILHREDLSLAPKPSDLSSVGLHPLPYTDRNHYVFAGYWLEHTAAYAKNLGALYWFDKENSILLTGSPEEVMVVDGKVRWLFGGYKPASGSVHDCGYREHLQKYRMQATLYAFLLQVNGYEQPSNAHAFLYTPDKMLYLSLRKKPCAQSDRASSRITIPLLQSSEPKILKVELEGSQQIRNVLAEVREVYDGNTNDDDVSCLHCRTEEPIAS